MNAYLLIIIFFLGAKYALNLIINILNVKNISPELPDEFKGYYDSSRYRKSQEYLKEKTKFGLAQETVTTFVIIFLILSGGFNLIDGTARNFASSEITAGLIFAGIIVLFFWFINLPFSLYNTFVIEQKFGFNKTTPAVYFTDTLKTFFLTVLLGAPLFSGIIWFFQTAGNYAWLYGWLFVVAAQFLITYIAPAVFLPMFNKYEPLPEGELRNEIERYADEQNFALKGIYRMDGSRRSTKSNAFFTGLGRFKRIVLFDTLIERHSNEELVAVLAHEAGHYKKGHILQGMIVGIIETGIMFYILSFFIRNPGLFSAFKMDNISVYAGLIFFGFLYAPLSFVLSIGVKALSRKNEYDADRFSVRTYKKPEAFITALKKLTVNNLGNLNPHPALVFIEYNHPPVLERIKAVRKEKNR